MHTRFMTIPALATCLLAGCGGGGSSSAPAIPAAPAPLRIACVGDSITAGYVDDGASHGYHADAARSYCGQAAAALGAAYTDAAIPGEVTAEILRDQVAKVPADASVVVAFAGTNDCLRQADPAGLDALVAALRAQAPRAKLILLTVRRMTFTPGVASYASQTWNPHVRSLAASVGATVVDLENDPKAYSPSWPDDVHPDLTGASDLGATVAAAIRS